MPVAGCHGRFSSSGTVFLLPEHLPACRGAFSARLGRIIDASGSFQEMDPQAWARSRRESCRFRQDALT